MQDRVVHHPARLVGQSMPLEDLLQTVEAEPLRQIRQGFAFAREIDVVGEPDDDVAAVAIRPDGVVEVGGTPLAATAIARAPAVAGQAVLQDLQGVGYFGVVGRLCPLRRRIVGRLRPLRRRIVGRLRPLRRRIPGQTKSSVSIHRVLHRSPGLIAPPVCRIPLSPPCLTTSAPALHSPWSTKPAQ